MSRSLSAPWLKELCIAVCAPVHEEEEEKEEEEEQGHEEQARGGREEEEEEEYISASGRKRRRKKKRRSRHATAGPDGGETMAGEEEEPPQRIRQKLLRAGMKKKVQVVRAVEPEGMILVSDTESCIFACLTPACITALAKAAHGRTVGSLGGTNHSLVQLSRFHVSTVAQNRPFLKSRNVSFPLALQVQEIQYIGADGCTVFGDPVDINSDRDVRHLVRAHSYPSLCRTLAMNQFVHAAPAEDPEQRKRQRKHLRSVPANSLLPEATGALSCVQSYGPGRALLKEHSIISPEQQAILDGFEAFARLDQLYDQHPRRRERQVLELEEHKKAEATAHAPPDKQQSPGVAAQDATASTVAEAAASSGPDAGANASAGGAAEAEGGAAVEAPRKGGSGNLWELARALGYRGFQAA